MTTEEIEIARQKMESYVLFAENKGVREELKTFYRGAAAAINDLLCSLGYGDEVSYLIERMQKDDTTL